MSHYYSYCYCKECENMDLSDRNRYDQNEAFCTVYRKYYNPNDRACSDKNFVYKTSLENYSGCYITTIVCCIMNLEDDCIYLETLRNFRDNYMKFDPNLLPILLTYDLIGPKIAENLLNDPLKNEKAVALLENFIKPITSYINNGNYTIAIEKYEKMTSILASFYHIDIPNIDIEQIDIDINDIGKGHKLLIKSKEI